MVYLQPQFSLGVNSSQIKLQLAVSAYKIAKRDRFFFLNWVNPAGVSWALYTLRILVKLLNNLKSF